MVLPQAMNPKAVPSTSLGVTSTTSAVTLFSHAVAAQAITMQRAMREASEGMNGTAKERGTSAAQKSIVRRRAGMG